jgi:hypothetical protein
MAGRSTTHINGACSSGTQDGRFGAGTKGQKCTWQCTYLGQFRVQTFRMGF